jgi:hypothetical protein
MNELLWKEGLFKHAHIFGQIAFEELTYHAV